MSSRVVVKCTVLIVFCTIASVVWLDLTLLQTDGSFFSAKPALVEKLAHRSVALRQKQNPPSLLGREDSSRPSNDGGFFTKNDASADSSRRDGTLSQHLPTKNPHRETNVPQIIVKVRSAQDELDIAEAERLLLLDDVVDLDEKNEENSSKNLVAPQHGGTKDSARGGGTIPKTIGTIPRSIGNPIARCRGPAYWCAMGFPTPPELHSRMKDEIAAMIFSEDKIVKRPFMTMRFGDSELSWLAGVPISNQGGIKAEVVDENTGERCLLQFVQEWMHPMQSGGERNKRLSRVYIGVMRWGAEFEKWKGRTLQQDLLALFTVGRRRGPMGAAANEGLMRRGWLRRGLRDIRVVNTAERAWIMPEKNGFVVLEQHEHPSAPLQPGGALLYNSSTPHSVLALLEQHNPDFYFSSEFYLTHLDSRHDRIVKAFGKRRPPIVLIGPPFMETWRPCAWHFNFTTWYFLPAPTGEESSRCDGSVRKELEERTLEISAQKHPNETVLFLVASGVWGKGVFLKLFLETGIGAKDIVLDVGSTLDAMAGEFGTRDYNRDAEHNCREFAEGMPCDICRRRCGGRGCLGCKCEG